MKPVKGKDLYGFHQQLIVRFPFFAYIRRLDEATIRHYLQTSPAFREALFLASPGLLEASKILDEPLTDKNRRKVKKVLHSLCKYLSRMSARPTPFGLFAGCGVISWGNTDQQVVLSDQYHFHSRLDMGLLCAMYREILKVPVIRRSLQYTANSALYTWNGHIRYNAYLPYGRRQYLVNAVQETGYLRSIIEKCGSMIPYSELAQYISSSFEATEEEAVAFLDELINEQLLQSDLEPGVSGEEYWYRLLKRMQALGQLPEVAADDAYLLLMQHLQEIDRLIAQPRAESINWLERYNTLSSLCKAVAPKWEDDVLQVDLVGNATQQQLSYNYQQTILDGISALSRLSPRFPTKDLNDFIQLFSNRYEDQEVPLLEALDPESGVGYGVNKNLSGEAPLIRNFLFNQEEGSDFYNVKYTGAVKLIISRINDAPGANVLEITEEDLAGSNEKMEQLPPTFSVIFRVMDSAAGTVFLEHAGWPSGACMVGRFAHAAPGINNLLADINNVENQCFADDIVAEICHLPEDRFGNVVARPSFREYEIPVFSGPQLPDKQIPLSDLLVSVRNGQVILRSRKHNKRVIPRLSNAHNYGMNALPAYHFLGDLQNQDVMQWMGLNLEVLDMLGFKHVPRITYRQAVLSLETWFLEQDDLATLYNRQQGEVDQEQLSAFVSKWKLPQHFVWAEEDHELLVDVSNPLQVGAWLESCKHKRKIVLKEHPFMQPGATALNTSGQMVSSQYVTILYRRETTGSDYRGSYLMQDKWGLEADNSRLQRRFSLGDEWLYYKIYCGVKTADSLVAKHLLPLCMQMEAAGHLQQWFFIRYTDPDFHIRLRLHLQHTDHTQAVIQQLHTMFSPLLSSGYIWKVQTDTYAREIERYGSSSVEACEAIFHYDSMAVAALLAHQQQVAGFEEVRWLWTLRAIDTLLADFQLDVEQKFRLMNGMKVSFQQEFDSNAVTIRQLADRYRFYKNKIQDAVAGQLISGELAQILDARSSAITPYAAYICRLEADGKLEVVFEHLLASIIHMSVNRVFKAQHRAHELLIYDFLFNFYKSRKAMALRAR